MKKGMILHFIFGIMYVGGAAWAIVGFLIYLFKDQPFNWWSVAVLVIGLIGAIINFLATANRISKDMF